MIPKFETKKNVPVLETKCWYAAPLFSQSLFYSILSKQFMVTTVYKYEHGRVLGIFFSVFDTHS